VWLRHLVLAVESGLWKWPRRVAELGPGESLGVGLCALLTGSNTYCALDIVPYASDPERNLELLDQLVLMFEEREPVPGFADFPNMQPDLPSYEFPHSVLTPELLRRSLSGSRLDVIRRILSRPGLGREAGLEIAYHAPWDRSDVVLAGSIDFAFSQAVLEHVDDIAFTYKALNRWLIEDGLMSHTIDFGSHEIVSGWNGHWTISDPVWRLILGRRAFLINRCPWSLHKRTLSDSGFCVVSERLTMAESDVRRRHLAPRFRSLSQGDLTTRVGFVHARKIKDTR
jgi:SAM-dependent methyltransferase